VIGFCIHIWIAKVIACKLAVVPTLFEPLESPKISTPIGVVKKLILVFEIFIIQKYSETGNIFPLPIQMRMLKTTEQMSQSCRSN
jgi:hypothetical protein